MAIERLSEEEYKYIMFESLVRALAAMEEMFQKCKIDRAEKDRYLIIKRRLYRTINEILK